MPSKVALVRFDRCNPERCDGGICVAALACPHKLLKQEAPHQIPMPHPSLCQGCGDCVRSCPLKAIQIVTMYGTPMREKTQHANEITNSCCWMEREKSRFISGLYHRSLWDS